MVVLLQWAAWSQLGLNTTPSPVTEMSVSGEDAGKLLKSESGNTAANAFDQDVDSKPRTAGSGDLCQQLRGWPLPGCNMG
ncbi:MAG: hypothetical protein EA349_09160 [Halomonadaceae bacterium]|nr:MAG: hypothetical protein EA349_09160 [Halomonadaceae bacterium]